MKIKISLALSAIILSLAVFSIVKADEGKAIQAGVKIESEAGNDDSSINTDIEQVSSEDATNTDDQSKNQEGDAAVNKGDNGDQGDSQLSADEHRGSVAESIKSLLDIADRHSDIGGEVRVIARDQDDSASTSAEAIDKIQSENGFRSFLFGSDRQSLGQLRAEMAKSQSGIDKLKRLISKVADTNDKATLSAQVQVLEDSQAKVSSFVQVHEGSFSLFGWFLKRFEN